VIEFLVANFLDPDENSEAKNFIPL
jgi:hypothetical protein